MRLFAASILCVISVFAQTAVEGTVVNSVTGEPVKRARVILTLIGRPSVPYATTSDASGHFLIDQVDAGTYSLMASRNGYPEQSKHSSVLTLEKGQALKNIVFRLAPQGIISGRVLDAEGDPLPDATVFCKSFDYELGKRQLDAISSTTTNDLGEFRLTDLTPGKYVISANRYPEPLGQVFQERPVATARPVEEGYITTYYPNTANPSGAASIEVSAGAQIGGINITLMRVKPVRIEGQVSGGVSTRARPITVTLYQHGEKQYPWDSEEVTVDSQGVFQIQNILPGQYVLRARYTVNENRLAARVSIQVRDSNIDGIELALLPTTELQGRLIIEDKGDLSNVALVVLLDAGELGMGNGALKLEKGPSFKMGDLAPGPYRIRMGGLPENFFVKSIRLGEQEVSETGIDLTQGVPAQELTIVVNLNAGVIEGSAKNADDEPATGARVTLIPDIGHRSLTVSTDTDQNGHFILKGVAPGDYKIYAWEDIEDGAEQDPDFMKPHESEGKTVSIKERSHETVQLKAIPAPEKTAQ